MGWFDSEYVTTSNLAFQSSGSVSLKSYYNFRKNIFYGSDFNTEITGYELNKYKRNFKRDYNKLQLQYYGIENNTLTYTGEFISSLVEEALATTVEEIGPLVTGPIAIDETRIVSYPHQTGVLPRDETYYSGLPSSITTTERNEMIVNEIDDIFVDIVWNKSTIIELNSSTFIIYENVDYTNTLVQGRRKVYSSVYMYPNRRTVKFDFYIEKQSEDGVDENDNQLYSNDTWEIDYTFTDTKCDISAFTTHAITAEYDTLTADNLSNVVRETIQWTESIDSNATEFTNSYPEPERECLYIDGADILASDLSPSAPISFSVDTDPIAGLKESNTNMYDPDVNYDDLTEEEKLKQKGLEKMFRSLGGSTSSYRDLMANPNIDDLSAGSFIDFNIAVKSSIVSKMGFDMFFFDDGTGVPKSSGTGVASLSNCSGGSSIVSDIPLGTSTMKIRAKSNQWGVSKATFFDTYPTEDTVVFEDGLLWRASVYTDFTEKDVSEEIIQRQYKECLTRLKEDYKDVMGSDDYEDAWNRLFGHIEVRSNPEDQPVDDIITLALDAKAIAATFHTGGVYVSSEAHGSFSSLVDSCENHGAASATKVMSDKVIVSVPVANPTDADIITAVKKLGGKYEFFENVSLKLRASSSSTIDNQRYYYASCRSRNFIPDEEFGEKNDGVLVFTFLRLDTDTDTIDAVSLYSMQIIYESIDLNWTFKQWYGNKDKIDFCVPIEYNSLFHSDTNFYEFMYLATITNGSLIFCHKTTEIKWYQTETWGMIFQVVLVVIAIAILVVSFGSATSVSAFLIATAEAIMYAYVISETIDFIVTEFDLNPNIGIIAKVVASIAMGDANGAVNALRLVDAGLKYYTAEINDSIARAVNDIETIRKKSKDLKKAYLLEESLSEHDTIAQWAKEMHAEMQSHLDVETSFGVPLDMYKLEVAESEAKYNPETISLNVSPSVSSLFSSGSKIVSTRDFKYDDFLKSFPRH